MTINVLISIGNSDDRLTQQQWSRFIAATRSAVRRAVITAAASPSETANQHGEWFSAPDSPWQNANWLVELVHGSDTYMTLRQEVRNLCVAYDQDSIAWTEGAVTFLSRPE